jgi:hypothetical protein
MDIIDGAGFWTVTSGEAPPTAVFPYTPTFRRRRRIILVPLLLELLKYLEKFKGFI